MLEEGRRDSKVLIFHLVMMRIARIAARDRGAGRARDVVEDCL